MSAKGCCWDNALVESFFSTLKHELDLDDVTEPLLSSQQLQSRLAFWIDGYYTVSVVTQRLGTSARSITNSSSSLPVHSPPRGPDHCPLNWGNPSTHPNSRLITSGRKWLVQRHIEDGVALADLVPYVGISHPTAYKWLAHYRACGAAALWIDAAFAAPTGGRSIRSNSSRPGHSAMNAARCGASPRT
jgi:hypothetical protein